MNPRLIAVTGPHKGTIFPLQDSELTVGRQPTNTIYLEDELVSRRHCTLKFESGQAQIVDLESMNGTFVNGVSIHQQKLELGDRIKIGASKFVFMDSDESGVNVPTFTEQEDDHFKTKMTLRLERGDAVYLAPDKIENLALSSRLARDLGALVRISSSINGIRETDELQSRLLELIFQVIPAERGAILLVGAKPDSFATGAYRESDSDANTPFKVSRTLTHQVVRDGAAIMSNDVLSDEAIHPTQSLLEARVHSVICVPLTIFDKTLGVIYLDSTSTSSGFDPDHLQLVTAIAGLAAVALEHVRYVEWLEGENERLREETSGELGMIGESPLMKEVFRKISRVATTDSTVLIFGESGTGKELVAGAIHRVSKRAQGPFVSVNCAVATDTLLESDLFGHEKGSFTGALSQKKGKFELADGGTLFLDEVGEMSLSMQAMLLRVLEDGEVRRIGAPRTINVNVRVVVATNRNLQVAIAEGKFRQDLFFRLNVFPLNLPPLRERREDIPALASYFMQKCAREMNRPVVGFAPGVLDILCESDWPGNVRELENNIARAIIMCVGERILREDLPENLNADEPPADSPMSYEKAHEELSKKLIVDAFRKAQYKYTDAARLLSLHPNYLHRLIRNLDIKEMVEGLRTTSR